MFVCYVRRTRFELLSLSHIYVADFEVIVYIGLVQSNVKVHLVDVQTGVLLVHK
jgi:hypothetical protein